MASAQIGEPPSGSKLDLIRRFLRAAGIQDRLDTGQFLERLTLPGTPLFALAARKGETFGGAQRTADEALKSAYASRRQAWQEEYESHVNWEFTETELLNIVDFLEAPEGKHFLEGRWRMDAYIETNTEELVEQIVNEATAALG
ncbi:hypothetical protein [Sphingobium scionense]|uniref:Uncharacterized protein n=1 Tax=Sphingobium scionense TaxID=1404341 RepID=A0A7W6LX66_9SPHN|nr:hypothetical protein [Sphingobium scionense]MBB4152016.1 hypothetical protein [Sphingobium scionense]